MFPILLGLAPSIIQGIEKIFGGKAKSGSDKKDAVLQLLRTLAEKIKISLPEFADANVTDDALSGAIEAILLQLKASGQLTSQPNSGSLYFVQGTVTPLKSI